MPRLTAARCDVSRYAATLVQTALLVLLASGWVAAESAAQPTDASGDSLNIVLLFADDMGYGDLSSYGHPTIRTTHLDRMAREGIRLTSFYAAEPACTPSRAALLTGRYPIRSGFAAGVVMPDSKKGMPPSEITLAEALSEAGYRTAMVGKWHLGHAKEAFWPTANGFDSYFGLIYSNDMQRPWVQTDKPLALYRGTEQVEHPVDQSTLTERYTSEAVDVIQSAGDEPFFLYLSYNMPHLPVHTSERFQGTSRAGHYGDVIETIDWSAGRILETLEAEGLDENTLVVFTSDNGPWLTPGERMLQAGNKPWHVGSPGPLRGEKGNTYEGGVRVPAIAWGPGRIPAGQTSAEIATTMDLYTTLITAASGQVPDDRPVDGHNIMPLLTGATDTSSTRQFYYFRKRKVKALRNGPWKLRFENGVLADESSPELFNLDVDPAERYNRAEEFPRRVQQMKQQMQAFAQDMRARYVASGE